MFAAAQPLAMQIALVLLALPFFIMMILSALILFRAHKNGRPQSKKVMAVGAVATFLWLLITGGIFIGN